jgi:hypothetical protein
MSESPSDVPIPDPYLVTTDADGRRHYRVPIPASGRGKEKSYLIAESSLAPFSLEPGSPWSRLIGLIADAVVREMMAEAKKAEDCPPNDTWVIQLPEDRGSHKCRGHRQINANMKNRVCQQPVESLILHVLPLLLSTNSPYAFMHSRRFNAISWVTSDPIS